MAKALPALMRRLASPLLETTVRIAFPMPGGSPAAGTSAVPEPLFRSLEYRRFASGLLLAQLGAFALWQVEGLGRFLRAHSQCSWSSVVTEGRWWAAMIAHVCHRDPEHLATNLGTLLVPTFLLQCLLPCRSALALCVAAAASGSCGSLAFTYFTFAPAEPRTIGCVPWAAPRFNSLNEVQQCPQGHKLSLCSSGRDTPSAEHRCDSCGRGIHLHERMHRCGKCDYDLCLDCCGRDAGSPLHLHRFRNAFDEFCFLREAELAIGFDTMMSETPYVSNPNILHSMERLDLRRASELCRPYLEWWEQSSRGSMGSSALASALSATCALWLGDLALRGWRHPLLSLFCVAAAMQPLVDLARVAAVLRSHGELDTSDLHVRRCRAEDSDFVGHLAGTSSGVLWYVALLRRAGGAVPLYPLIALARAKL